jgi:hypothetical protein
MMPNANADSGIIQSWFDLPHMMPKNVLDFIAYAELNSVAGTYSDSSTFVNSTWVDTPLVISSDPTVAANRTDNLQDVAEAEQWTMQHGTWNSSSALAPPLTNKTFMRAGIRWTNSIVIELGAEGVTDCQIGFLINAATRGDSQGTYPVIAWSSINLTDDQTFKFTFKRPGHACLGIRTIAGGSYSMYALDIIAVP